MVENEAFVPCVWLKALEDMPGSSLFALVDAAVDPQVLSLIANESLENECLFGYPLDTPIAKNTPRIVQIRTPQSSSLLRWIERKARVAPVATLLATRISLGELAAHLKACTDTVLEGIDSMYLAFWDPSILGTLIGQPDDKTLHVAGPVLTESQVATLRGSIDHWWYWDREGIQHDVAVPKTLVEPQLLPLVLKPEQVDMLVEAAVPDHLLQYIDLNQPHLLIRTPVSDQYQIVRKHLLHARQIGLVGTGDMLNYVSSGLLYGEALRSDPLIIELLDKVSTKELTFDQAMDQFP